MRILADENVRPAHVSALVSAGHDVRRVGDVLRKGASDQEVLAAGRETDRVIVTYDRKDFADATGHVGVFIADETTAPRELRRTTERVGRAYPTLDDIVEFLADWR